MYLDLYQGCTVQIMHASLKLPMGLKLSYYLHLKQFFVENFPGFPNLRVSASQFFDSCDSIVFHPTFAKMPNIRKTFYIVVDVIEVPRLTLVDFLSRFPNILCPALSACDTIDDIGCFACHRLANGEIPIRRCNVNFFPKCPLSTRVATFIPALMKSLP